MNDLEERTIIFSQEIIRLIKRIKISILNKNIIEQLLRSATSIGANYQEANGASSKKDFKNKISICKKEAMETKYWLRLLAEVEEGLKEKIRILWKESHELTLIFSKIVKSTRNND